MYQRGLLEKQLIADHLHFGAPVLCAAFFGWYYRLPAWLAPNPLKDEALRIYAFSGEVFNHRLCPVVGQHQVIFGFTYVIGVSANLDLDRWVITQQYKQFVELGGRFGFEVKLF